jgi:signal transduction histidine kinase
MRRRGTLRRQLLLSYLPLVLAPILVVGIVTGAVAGYGLSVLVTRDGQERARIIAGQFARYYAERGSWQDVERLFDDLAQGMMMGGMAAQTPLPAGAQRGAGPRGPSQLLGGGSPRADDIMIADPGGVVVAANRAETIGQTLSDEVIRRGHPILVRGKTVGVLVIGSALGELDTRQRELLGSVNLALIISGAVSAVLTILVGLWFSRQISRPVETLMSGVKTLADGNWTHALPVTAPNELGELTDSFNHMAHALTQQDNLRRQMVADISHDLRTPLSVMALEIEAIQAGMKTPEQAADSLHDEIEWLQRLVDDLHTLALMDAGQFHLQCEPTELTLFLGSVYRQWCTMAAQQGRPFMLDVSPDTVFAAIDAPRVRQLLGNLIGNAFHHTPASASVTLSAQIDTDSVRIEVTDRGPGIPPADLPHLFDRFYRGDRSRGRSSKIGGSGLGLSIAYQLATLHGGTLSVQSEPGQGARFTLRLMRLAVPQHSA